MSNVRRVFFYIVTLVTLGITAAGAGVLLSLILDIITSAPALTERSGFIQQQLSLGLAMLVIGGPLWFFFWRSVQRHVRGQDSEIGAAFRKLFLNFILTASVLAAFFSGQQALAWLVSGLPQTEGSSASLASFIVSLAVWFYHWKISEGEGHPSAAARTLRRWYIYIVSGYGLVFLTIGIIQLINSAVRFLPFWGDALVSANFWGGWFQSSLVGIILSGFLWGFHWFRMSRNDTDSSLRQVYIYLLAIVASSIAGLTALIISLYRTLAWVTGALAVNPDYFRFLGWAIPMIGVTAGIWTYHQAISRDESAQVRERRLSSRRIHLYLMSFIGLGTLVSGLVILFGMIIGLIINAVDPAVAMQAGWWQRQLSLCLSLIIVAAPIYLYYWNRILRLVETGGQMEPKTRSRRIYLYVIIGASIIALAAGAVNLVYQVLGSLLNGSFGIQVLQNSTWSIEALLIASPLLVYHWRTARQEQRRGAENENGVKSVSAIVSPRYRDTIASLEKSVGIPIRIMEYTGPDEEILLNQEDIEALAAQLKSSSGPRILITQYGGKLIALPYKDK